MLRDTIRIEPGALNDVPVIALAQFLAAHGLEIVADADGWRIRRAVQAADYPQQEEVTA